MRQKSTLTQQDRGNIRFHVAMHAAAIATGKRVPTALSLAALDSDSIAAKDIDESVEAVYNIYQGLGATDAVSKSSDFLAAVRDDLAHRVLS